MNAAAAGRHDDLQAVLARSVDFEVSIAELARRSERRAWRVAGCAIAMAVLLAAGCLAMLPLKERVPFLVLADAYTGTATVARLQGDPSRHALTKSEAIARSNVAHFLVARESYDAGLVDRRDWTTVWTMSSPAVGAEYRQLRSRNNPGSPANAYGKGASIRIEILSLVLLGDAAGPGPHGATVRFQRNLFDKAAGTSTLLDNRIATLQYAYNDHLALDDHQRIENPLGFQVTHYRVDNDYVSTPAVPVRPRMTSSTTHMEQVDGVGSEDRAASARSQATGTPSSADAEAVE